MTNHRKLSHSNSGDILYRDDSRWRHTRFHGALDGQTYEAENCSYAKGVGIAAYSCTPLFVASVCGFYPILWLDIIVVTVALMAATVILWSLGAMPVFT